MGNVNPNGGSIALGDPLGATSGRMTASLLREMKRRGDDSRYGVVAVGSATGVNAAAVFEHEG